MLIVRGGSVRVSVPLLTTKLPNQTDENHPQSHLRGIECVERTLQTVRVKKKVCSRLGLWKKWHGYAAVWNPENNTPQANASQ